MSSERQRAAALAAQRQALRGDLQTARLAFAVYRLRDGKITDVWFSNQPSDADAFAALFAFD